MLIRADARAIPLKDESIDCCITSPPYWGLRNYGDPMQIGLEASPELYVDAILQVFSEVRRVLKPEGTLWLNLGDTYASAGGAGWQGKNGQRADRRFTQGSLGINRGRRQVGDTKNPAAGLPETGPNRYPISGLKPKDLAGIPWRVAFALQSDGWWLRSDIIWSKPNPMPESVTDRPTKAHEYVFLLSKSEMYHYDQAAIAEKVAPSQVGRVRSDAIGGSSHFERGQHSAGGVYKTDKQSAAARPDGGRTQAGFNARWDAKERIAAAGKHSDTDPNSSCKRMIDSVATSRANGADHDQPFGLTRNARTVWTIPTQPYLGAHFATFPPELVRRCILAGCPPGGIVLDPFVGSGTTVKVARELGREGIGLDVNAKYLNEQATSRIKTDRGFSF